MINSMNIRRVVTDHDPHGKAIVVIDDLVPGKPVLSGDAAFSVMWVTANSPADNNDATDRARDPIGLVQAGGSVLRVVDIAPGVRSPLHRTQSLDYGLVLSGEIDLELDDGHITHLNAGDVVVQRGTIHAWINRGATTARMAFILLDAKPVIIGGAELPPVHHDIKPQ